jgi:hypothetical protein
MLKISRHLSLLAPSILLTLIYLSALRSPKSHISIKIFYHNTVSCPFIPVRVTCLSHLILLDLIPRVTKRQYSDLKRIERRQHCSSLSYYVVPLTGMNETN